MGLTKDQYVGMVCNEVAWLGWRDRLTVLRSLVFAKATDENGKRLYKYGKTLTGHR